MNDDGVAQRRAMGSRFLIVFVALLVGASACGFGSRGADDESRGSAGGGDGPRLTFQRRSHDFGRISTGQHTEYRFGFTNTGGEQLQIGDISPEPARPGG